MVELSGIGSNEFPAILRAEGIRSSWNTYGRGLIEKIGSRSRAVSDGDRKFENSAKKSENRETFQDQRKGLVHRDIQREEFCVVTRVYIQKA